MSPVVAIAIAGDIALTVLLLLFQTQLLLLAECYCFRPSIASVGDAALLLFLLLFLLFLLSLAYMYIYI